MPKSEVKKARQGYFLQDDLFLRAWAPCGEVFSGDPVVQVVLPLKYRTPVIQVAHGHIAGHMLRI